MHHTFERPGRYEVTLTVTDGDGDVATDTVAMVVTGPPADDTAPAGAPLPTTGGGAGLLALGLLGLARTTRRRRG